MKTAIFSLLAVLVLLSGCDRKDSAADMISPVQQTNSITLTDTEGKSLKVNRVSGGFVVEGQKDKAVLMVFFATWCPPCKAEVPHLVSLQKKFADSLSIVAVLVEQNKPNEEIKKFISDKGINYIVTNGQENFKMATAVGGVKGIPAMYLYDKNGALVQNYTGATPEAILEIDIKKAVGK